jgi:hypothetical protein
VEENLEFPPSCCTKEFIEASFSVVTIVSTDFDCIKEILNCRFTVIKATIVRLDIED